MKTTCPRIVNRWLSTAKVTKWFKIHRAQLLQHIESKHPASAPPRLWWVSLMAMQHFTHRTSVAFCSIQGLTTLLEQQQAALNDLVGFFKEDVGVEGPLDAEAIGDLDLLTHVTDGKYAVQLSSVHEFLCGLASWIDTLIDEAIDVDRNNLFKDIGQVYVTACNRIDSICVHRNHNNDPFDDPTALPPVLPHEIVKLSAFQFLQKIRKNTFRLDHRYSSSLIDVIADEQKALRHAYRTEPVLKDAIDQISGRSSFKEGWSAIAGARFQNLIDYCGVVATLFPGTSTVESDFSVLRWEKDGFRKQLSDIGLEGVMQAKQYCFIQQLLPPERNAA
jgi:hypothetical protein